MNLDFLTLNAAIIPAMCVRKFKLNSSLNFQQSKFRRGGIVDDRSTAKAKGKAERRRMEDDEKSEIAKGVSPLHCYADACCCWLLNSRRLTMAHKTIPCSLFTPSEGISAAVSVNKVSSHIHIRSRSYEEFIWLFLHNENRSASSLLLFWWNLKSRWVLDFNFSPFQLRNLIFVEIFSEFSSSLPSSEVK